MQVEMDDDIVNAVVGLRRSARTTDIRRCDITGDYITVPGTWYPYYHEKETSVKKKSSEQKVKRIKQNYRALSC